jgi:two-component system, cell cycle sensor histidine kinase and response regulator CckA
MVGAQIDTSRELKNHHRPDGLRPPRKHPPAKNRILIVENEVDVRDLLGELLEERGYEVSSAGDGSEALTLLRSEAVPDLIILDLNLPVMDGWQFRTIQKDDPKLGIVPVLAISADTSPKAAAISAQGYLRKPFGSQEIVVAVERILAENAERTLERQGETERLASLGRVAANVGHEINNPLAFVMLNLRQSIKELDGLSSEIVSLQIEGRAWPAAVVERFHSRVLDVTTMLQECETGAERIRGTVTNLQRLSTKSIESRESLDVNALLEESASMVWNQIRHRAHLTKIFGDSVMVRGNRAALGQVFLNLLINAAQSIPEGRAERNDIQIETRHDRGVGGPEITVEISDSGAGMAPEVVARVFEPYFTTKRHGEWMGLGLSISRQTIIDHGGRMTVRSEVGRGTVFRVSLPIDGSPTASRSPVVQADRAMNLPRGRVLVVDDEPLIGRVLQTALKSEHEVVVVSHAAEALTLLEEDATFDVVLCDLVMPDISGPEFYARVNEQWPRLASRVVFMSGGAFTPQALEFIRCGPTSVLSKPFALEQLKRVIREHIRDDS